MTTLSQVLTASTALAGALVLPGLAEARQVTLTTELANYGGDGAYLAFYVTDASGKYMGSLWMSGGRSKYYRHLSGWEQASGGDPAEVAGITGASVGQGQTLTLTLDLADSLFDAGYVLHVDAAVEHMRDSPDEIAVPLTAAGVSAKGGTYIAKLSYKS
ncbi:DUF2271 domain-containing protein [Stagnihabitans tardus]|uniref:DUF2271 domain-containing protein n=1 Tax=Stagnihabitans tardus TaxID=2699202 RepID=A0AAE4YBP6_9RHOB|nr:DUF2271 domain-containing protein [Stagnihabitans tardus]NBZ86995.1 DUF2271 domain-containing protein [Stagnihabitans tardus]